MEWKHTTNEELIVITISETAGELFAEFQIGKDVEIGKLASMEDDKLLSERLAEVFDDFKARESWRKTK